MCAAGTVTAACSGSPCTRPDLSFNNIEVIEGLDTLTKLTDLSLYNNAISEITGLDTLVNLNVLSLGNNKITSTEQIHYLRRFQVSVQQVCWYHDHGQP